MLFVRVVTQAVSSEHIRLDQRMHLVQCRGKGSNLVGQRQEAEVMPPRAHSDGFSECSGLCSADFPKEVVSRFGPTKTRGESASLSTS
ncbi:hypothetical protein CK221_03065 [Mesorhizobium sp. WSM3868]|nr:hypothetical protein CK221_03065 [Mesorhizobium sp. WSM3868]